MTLMQLPCTRRTSPIEPAFEYALADSLLPALADAEREVDEAARSRHGAPYTS